jgi:hypothetical protein
MGPKQLLWWLLGAHAEQVREPMDALGADRAGKAGTHPGQVISAIIPARRIDGRVWVVLTSCGGGYGRGGRGSSLSSGVSMPDAALR